MSDCNVNIATHNIAGRTQSDRMPIALDQEFVKIDERGIQDLIVATCKMSSHINFFGGDNIVIGNWSNFFSWESTSVLAQIASVDVQYFLNRYKLLRRTLVFLPQDQHRDKVDPFFFSIKELLDDLVLKINRLPSDLTIREYYRATTPKFLELLNTILEQVSTPENFRILFKNHLFNKKIQNLFGLLNDWKKRGHNQLYINLEDYPSHSPQYALYLTFLKLFENAQKDLNTFTKRHLDFYYKDVLRLRPQQAGPDFVHCHIEPHAGVDAFQIEKGSVFLAGKDSEGHNKFYAATSDVTINQSKIHAIYGGTKSSNHYYFQDYTDTNNQGERWSPFLTETEASPMGSVFASKLLLLKGGVRVVKLDFQKSNGASITLDIDNYEFYLSGEEGWFKIETPSLNGSKVELSLSSEDPPIVPLDTEIHEGLTIKTEYPVLKIQSKQGRLAYFKYNRLVISVDVSNYKMFKVFSDVGTIDHTKAFEPFGLIPKNGQSITFACKEYFSKNSASGKLSIVTEDTGTSTWPINNNTKLLYLKNGVWEEENDWDTDTEYPLINLSPIKFDPSEEEPLRPADSNGFLKIILNKGYNGEKYLNDFITQSKLPEPSLPYIPTINEITFSYKASSSNNGIEIYNVTPLGYRKAPNNKKYLIPVINDEGTVFIGFSDVKQGNSLSVLFQLSDGSANPRQEPVEPVWKYLHQDRWVDFEPEDFGDETNGLTDSGIIELRAPEDLNLDNQTVLPPNIWWVKISIHERIDAICQFVGIHTQALKATLFDHENSGLEFIEKLEASVISKLFNPKNEIKKIEQPYLSFGGRLTDSDELFYQRSSERLRHKNKAISIWDYETLILDNFPEVYRVKCLNHFRLDSALSNNSSSGYVTIIPVAKGTNKDVPVYWKPIVNIGTMKKIKSFLESKASPHARINVKPPKLESLELVFDVKYHDIPGADSRFYTNELSELINSYLSPWAYSKSSEIEFQKEIEKSRLIQLIETQSFVDYISNFKVNHHIMDDNSEAIIQSFNDVVEIKPKSVFSLFVPYKQSITTITKTCCV